MRSADFARMLEDLASPERQAFIRSLDPGHAAEILEEMDPRRVREVLRRVPAKAAAEFLDRMAPDEAADALRDLTESERSDILAHVSTSVAASLANLSEYAPDQAGGLMTTTLAFIGPRDTIAEARDAAIAHRGHGDVQDLVVIDDDGRLIDDLPLMEVLANEASMTVDQVIGPPRPRTVLPTAPLKTVVRELTANRTTSLIVVDERQRPIGRILADDVIDVLAGSRRRRRWPWQPHGRRRSG